MNPHQKTFIIVLASIFINCGHSAMLTITDSPDNGLTRELIHSAHAQERQEIVTPADLYIREGVNHFRKGRYQQAFDAFHKALAIYKSAGNLNGQAFMLHNLGVAALEINRTKEAIDYLSESLSIYRRINDEKLIGELLELLGRAYREVPDYTKAMEIYEQLLKHSHDTAENGNTLIALGSLGSIHENLQDFDKATCYFRQVVNVSRDLGDRVMESRGLWHLGEISIENENYVQAISNFQQALQLVRELNDAPRQAEVLWKLGNCYYFLGAYDRSSRYLKESLTLARQLGDNLTQSRALRTLGSVYYFQDDLERAIHYYKQDLAVVRELKDEQREGTALGNLALALTNLGKYEQALDYHRQDLAIARKMGNSLSEGQALVNLAPVYIYLKNYRDAINSCKNAITTFRTIGYRRGEGIALTNMGLALFRARQFKQAEQTLIDAIEVFDTIREKARSVDAYHVSIFETHLRTYRYLQMTLVAQGRQQEALVIAEHGRARALGELLKRRGTVSDEHLAPVPDLAAIRRLATVNQASFVEYSIIPEETLLYIWVVQPDGQIVFAQSNLGMLPGGEKSLAERVENSRRAIGLAGRGVRLQDVPITGLYKELNNLYQLLIQPIEEYLPQNPDIPVVIFPQGALFLVPFAALTDDQGQYLLDHYTLLTAPSIQTLQLATTNLSATGSGLKPALVVGNPIMPTLQTTPVSEPIQLPDLPGADREAQVIAQLLGTRALTGKLATKQSVADSMRGSALIHLATHGLLDDLRGVGIPGALAFTPSSSDDGLLTSAEVMDMRLTANLVVLSACDTGQGKITGDGVIGLSRSFIAAGARSVVVSLWKVPDIPTAELMTSFYKHLQRNYPKAAALRLAMLETRQSHPHPANWAAFTLVGDSGRRP